MAVRRKAGKNIASNCELHFQPKAFFSQGKPNVSWVRLGLVVQVIVYSILRPRWAKDFKKFNPSERKQGRREGRDLYLQQAWAIQACHVRQQCASMYLHHIARRPYSPGRNTAHSYFELFPANGAYNSTCQTQPNHSCQVRLLALKPSYQRRAQIKGLLWL